MNQSPITKATRAILARELDRTPRAQAETHHGRPNITH
jgi:hypothetical protein